MTCTVEITLHALSQRSPAESIGKGQKLIEAARPEGAEALSPGQRPGLSCSQTWRPVRAKALKLTLKFIKLLPLQGALLTVTIPRAMPWAKSFCPFRACSLSVVWVERVFFFLECTLSLVPDDFSPAGWLFFRVL